MKRENAFDTFAVGNAPHGECFVKPAPFAANHDAGENLNPLLVALHHSRVHADAIAHGKLRSIALLLLFFDGVNNAVHNYPSDCPAVASVKAGPAAGRTFSGERAENANRNLQPRACAASGRRCSKSDGPRGRGYKGSYTSSFRVVAKLCSRFVPVIIDNTAPVVQLDRATASGAVGCAFEPRRAHII